MEGDGRNKHCLLEGGVFFTKKRKTPPSGAFGSPLQHTNRSFTFLNAFRKCFWM